MSAQALEHVEQRTLPRINMPKILLKDSDVFKNTNTSGAWIPSAHAETCWVNHDNERTSWISSDNGRNPRV